MTEGRSNKHPEFLQETMFQEHGTRVLITNPASDQYLSDTKKKIKDKYSQWTEEPENS